MPTYVYACDACGHEFERQQRITEQPIKKCPSCGKLKARRMIGGGGFILKGSGWESDLYSGPSNSKKSDEKTTSTTETSGSTKESSTPTKESATPKPSKPSGDTQGT